MAIETAAQMDEWMKECVGEYVDNESPWHTWEPTGREQIEFKCVLATRWCDGLLMCVHVWLCVLNTSVSVCYALRQ